ncbi:hypothetical protein CRYUN_Cryun25bG0047600 [Craigia yunnanensis]
MRFSREFDVALISADFQGFAKHSRLFPSTELKVFTKTSEEKIFSSTSLNEVRSFYKVRLQTSNMYGSSLSNINAGILLCLIDEKGSVDEFVFAGPKLVKVEVLWISIESGQWRLGGVSLIILNKSQSSLGEDYGENFEYVGAKYDFNVDDILLGEGGDESMVELRPCLVTELSVPNVFMMLCNGVS